MKTQDERTILYLNNGESYLGDNNTYKESLKILKEKGYKLAYSGRKFSANGQKVLVGINDNNIVKLRQRRENGLWRATLITIK